MAKTPIKAGSIAIAGVGFLLLTASATVQAQGAISRGEVIATTCYTCHGTYGVSSSSIPPINEISPDRMIHILQGFRSGQRASTVMGRHATAYTNEEITEVAHYLGNLKTGRK